MISFRQFLLENSNKGEHIGAELSVTRDPKTGRFVVSGHHIFRHGSNLQESLQEAIWTNKKEDNDVLDPDEAYRALGTFSPSSLDHATIAREFQEHLDKHGFYSASGAHVTVMSPEEQALKSYIKRRSSLTGRDPTHEVPHQDGAGSKTGKEPAAQFRMSKNNAVWSTNDGTQLFDMDNKRIRDPKANANGSVVAWDDSKIKHAASGATDRWFVRAGFIRKKRDDGKYVCASTNKEYENLDDFQKSRKKMSDRHFRDVKDYFSSDSYSDEHKHETANYLRKNHPDLFKRLGSRTGSISERWLRGYGDKGKPEDLAKRKVEEAAARKAKAEKAREKSEQASQGGNNQPPTQNPKRSSRKKKGVSVEPVTNDITKMSMYDIH